MSIATDDPRFVPYEKIDKKAPQEEKDKLKETNTKIEADNNNLMKKIAIDFSKFRRNFYAIPFE